MVWASDLTAATPRACHRQRPSCGRPQGDDGAIAIMVALLAVVLFGFAALVVDVGNAFNVREQAQHAVDVAARAGVQQLVEDNGTTDPAALELTVEHLVSQNIGGPLDWAGCADAGAPADGLQPVPGTACISYRVAVAGDPGSRYEVRVRFPSRHVPATFAGVLGLGSIGVSPAAAAAEGVIAQPCQPCVPPLDAAGQPSPLPTLSDRVKQALPDPATMTANTPPATDAECPTPGLYQGGSITTTCDSLAPGIYVFDGTSISFLGALTAVNVTLVFYGTGSFTVAGPLQLTATRHDDVSLAGEIPGVAVVTATDAQLSNSGAIYHVKLGDSFTIVGSILAINGDWATDAADCLPSAAQPCRVDATTPQNQADDDGIIAVHMTDFAAGVPTVAGNRPVALAPPDNSIHLMR